MKPPSCRAGITVAAGSLAAAAALAVGMWLFEPPWYDCAGDLEQHADHGCEFARP